MSFLLYSVALDSPFLLSDTTLRFSLYLMLCISEFRYFYFTITLAELPFIWYKIITILKPDNQGISIFLYSVALHCSSFLSDTALLFSFYLKLRISELRYFYFTINLASLASIWYKNMSIPKPDDPDMSIFLYSIALDSSCVLSDTALRFSLYLKLCISEFAYFYFIMKFA